MSLDKNKKFRTQIFSGKDHVKGKVLVPHESNIFMESGIFVFARGIKITSGHV